MKRSLEKYCYPLDPIIGVNVDSWKVNFEIPEFLSENERVGSLPDGMMIHEHHLKPMVDEGEEKFGIEAFKLLVRLFLYLSFYLSFYLSLSHTHW